LRIILVRRGLCGEIVREGKCKKGVVLEMKEKKKGQVGVSGGVFWGGGGFGVLGWGENGGLGRGAQKKGEKCRPPIEIHKQQRRRKEKNRCGRAVKRKEKKVNKIPSKNTWKPSNRTKRGKEKQL